MSFLGISRFSNHRQEFIMSWALKLLNSPTNEGKGKSLRQAVEY